MGSIEFEQKSEVSREHGWLAAWGQGLVFKDGLWTHRGPFMVVLSKKQRRYWIDGAITNSAHSHALMDLLPRVEAHMNRLGGEGCKCKSPVNGSVTLATTTQKRPPAIERTTSVAVKRSPGGDMQTLASLRHRFDDSLWNEIQVTAEQHPNLLAMRVNVALSDRHIAAAVIASIDRLSSNQPPPKLDSAS
jgi:hypothetical protein